jgi:hypothetical protein
MTRTTGWAAKVLALVKGGNPAAAIAQIRVAPSLKDLFSLQSALAAQSDGRWRDVDAAIADNIDAMSKPRLHRAP